MLGQAQQQTVEQNDDVTELEEAGTLVEEVELLEEEVELLEEEVKQKAERIAEYRGIILAQLETDLSSIFAAQRPVLRTRFDNGSVFQYGLSSDPCSSDVAGPTNIAMLAGEEAEKIQVLKKKTLENASAIPVALNRMKDCMARIDELQSCYGVIHLTFKRKRNS